VPPTTHIEIKDQAELERAFLELRKEVFLELKVELIHAGEAVRSEAQSRAGSEISNIGPRWQQMRIGATIKGVYVAPKTRPHGGSPRPNLAGELMESMQGALDAKRDAVYAEVDAMVDASAARHGFL
jgi:hypothetical protein